MRTIIVLAVYFVIIMLTTPVLLLCLLLGRQEPIFSIGKAAIRVGKELLGINIEVSGLGNIDREKPHVYMSNHLSFLDGPMLFLVIPQPIRVILKKEVMRIPVVGDVMKFIEFVPVDRKALKGGKQSIDRASRLIREKGYSFLIFPEGTRSYDGKLQAFKRGGFFLAIKTSVSIFPVTIRGSRELMPRGSFFIKKGKVSVTFHPPISIEGYDYKSIPRLSNHVRKIIQAEFKEL